MKATIPSVDSIRLAIGANSVALSRFGDRSIVLMAADYVIFVRLSDGYTQRFTYEELGF